MIHFLKKDLKYICFYSQNEELASLPVGTEVSAKYKGAFCEAKVKKVNRIVVCKVSFKQVIILVNYSNFDIQYFIAARVEGTMICLIPNSTTLGATYWSTATWRPGTLRLETSRRQL